MIAAPALSNQRKEILRRFRRRRTFGASRASPSRMFARRAAGGNTGDRGGGDCDISCFINGFSQFRDF
jgi:hypothetical protein